MNTAQKCPSCGSGNQGGADGKDTRKIPDFSPVVNDLTRALESLRRAMGLPATDQFWLQR
jgi:hypothetical protein